MYSMVYPCLCQRPSFTQGCGGRYPERDGMYFLPEQATEYDRHRLGVQRIEQLELFVSDEKTAIQWVRQQLGQNPRTYQELQPLYMRGSTTIMGKARATH